MMDRWTGKVAIVTGASAGIGAAIAKSLVNHGVKVVGLARRLDKLKNVAETLGKEKFYPVQCDLGKEEDILLAFKRVEKEFGGVDILVNNAGIVTPITIIDGPTSEYRNVIDTNLMAPAICAREFTKSIKKRNVSGHVININSIAGRFAEAVTIPFGMYCPSKYGLRALSTELRNEFNMANLRIKVTNISPGVVHTEMYLQFRSDNPDALKITPMLNSEDIADATIYALGTPGSTEVIELTIVPRGGSIVVVNVV